MDERVTAILRELRLDAETPRIPELAAAVGLSCSRLQHLFREAVGCSVLTFIRNARMQTAAERLCRSDDSVAAIGSAVGYRDRRNFLRDFRETFGVTPSVFRERHRDEERNSAQQN